jgi:hypothetical protein
VCIGAISVPIRAMIEQHAGEAKEEAWDAITQAATDAAGGSKPELLKCGAARLGNRLMARPGLEPGTPRFSVLGQNASNSPNPWKQAVFDRPTSEGG